MAGRLADAAFRGVTTVLILSTGILGINLVYQAVPLYLKQVQRGSGGGAGGAAAAAGAGAAAGGGGAASSPIGGK